MSDMKIPDDRERDLDRLLVRYREACGSPEAAPNFMPMLWQKIEARQTKALFFERMARMFVAGAMAACGCLGVLTLLPAQQPSPFYSSSYVEDIATANARETAPYLDPVRLDFSQDANPDSIR
jgi:hypothetical protein